MQNVRLYFIKQFENDYIIALQEREFYNRKFRNDLQLRKGDVVVNIPRMLQWKGRIVKLINVTDELVTGVEIKVYQTSLVKNTILKRPLQNLGLFETVDNKHDDIKVNNNIGSTSTLT